MTRIEKRKFPVLSADKYGCAKFVDWDALDKSWALKIHGQSLERLAERGGLCPSEILMNIKRMDYLDVKPLEEALKLTNSIAVE